MKIIRRCSDLHYGFPFPDREPFVVLGRVQRCPWACATLSVDVCNVVHGRVQRTKRHVETDNRHISSVNQDVVTLKRLRNAEEMVGGYKWRKPWSRTQWRVKILWRVVRFLYSACQYVRQTTTWSSLYPNRCTLFGASCATKNEEV